MTQTIAPMPTSGSARRRAKAARNLDRSYELESLAALIHGGIPAHAVTVTMCSCGMRAWLMPGHSPEAREQHDLSNEAHDSYCDALS